MSTQAKLSTATHLQGLSSKQCGKNRPSGFIHAGNSISLQAKLSSATHLHSGNSNVNVDHTGRTQHRNPPAGSSTLRKQQEQTIKLHSDNSNANTGKTQRSYAPAGSLLQTKQPRKGRQALMPFCTGTSGPAGD
eukprot:1148702-Pelagomonas_calceolata.AAC.2